MGRKLAEMLQYSVTFIGGLVYAFYVSWKASMIVLAVLPFMTLATLFEVKVNTTQTAKANESYAEAGSIVYTAVSSVRTILSLNGVERMVTKFKRATQDAFEGAARNAPWIGAATGSMIGSFLLAYIAITLFGAYLLYDAVKGSGCDPSGAVPDNDACEPRGADIFGALMGITFSAAVLPQVSTAIEAFTGARSACYPALVAMSRTVGQECKQKKEGSTKDGRSSLPLPKYEIDSSSPKGQKPPSFEGRIEFRDVSFAYPTRPETNVFEKFSLTIEAGQTVALVGPRYVLCPETKFLDRLELI